jgi:hypothetical protein
MAEENIDIAIEARILMAVAFGHNPPTLTLVTEGGGLGDAVFTA